LLKRVDKLTDDAPTGTGTGTGTPRHGPTFPKKLPTVNPDPTNTFLMKRATSKDRPAIKPRIRVRGFG
jgi:hypothetical protein